MDVLIIMANGSEYQLHLFVKDVSEVRKHFSDSNRFISVNGGVIINTDYIEEIRTDLT